MPGSVYEKVLELAADQHGYVTTSQDREADASTDALRKMATRGTLERVSWGVYRVPTFPPSTNAEYMEASLWPAGVRGVISHQSALALRGLSDVSPSAIHITVPDDFRIRRDPLNLSDVVSFSGITQDNPHDAAHSVTEKRLRLVGRIRATAPLAPF